MLITQDWAQTLGIPTAPEAPEIPNYLDAYARSAREIAVRTIVLHGITSQALGLPAQLISGWFTDQKIIRELSPLEAAFLQNDQPNEKELIAMGWKCEALRALLWTLGKSPALGLPTTCCDAQQLASTALPPVGSDIKPYLKQATLRSPGVILAEDLRTFNLWSGYHTARQLCMDVPEDLNLGVLFERRFAFEWLKGTAWDEVACGV